MEFVYVEELTDEMLHSIRGFVTEYCKSQHLESNPVLIDKFIKDNVTMGHTLLAVDDTGIVGGIMWLVVPYHFTGDPIMKKMAWFVTESRRQEGIGLELLKRAEQLSKELGALLSFTSSPVKHPLPKDYIPFETTYIKVL